MKKIDSINGLRGVLCLVIAFGAHLCFPDTNLGRFLNSNDWFYQRTVEVFCAISGFGMSIGYYDKIKTMKLSEYVKRRILKLYPLYWLTLIVCLIIQLLHYYFYSETAEGAFSLDLYSTILAFLGIENGWFIHANPVNSPLWSINCLILCYIIYYLVVKYSKEKTSYIISISIILLFSLTGIYNVWSYSFLNWDTTLRCLGSFYIGVLLKEVCLKKKWSIRVLIAEYISILYLMMLVLVEKMNMDFAMGNRASIAIIVLCPIFILSAVYVRPIKWILETKMLQKLGEMSMSIYMWNWMFYLIMRMYFPHVSERWSYIVAYILIHMVSVIILHKYVEPIILPHIKKWFIE